LQLLHEFGAKSSLKERGNQSSLYLPVAGPRGGARKLGVTRERLSDMANKTGSKDQKKDKQERDFFCVLSDAFRSFAQRSSILVGSAWAFGGAVLVILVWLITGPAFHFSDTWQLIINTATTIITFMMVFLIQNTQNRDAKAMQLKLDELIRALKDARNQLVDLEELSDDDLKKLEEQFRQLRKHSENGRRTSDNSQPAKSR
jgi:low affinity Fe/Cu permease